MQNSVYCLQLLHSHKQQKDGLELRAVLLIFSLELEISRVAVQRILLNSKKWWALWGIAQWTDTEAILANACYYNYEANASEVVQKIAIDQKYYHKFSSCIIVWWIVKIYHSMTMKKGWLVTCWYTSIVAKKLQKLHRKMSNNWTMVCFIHNRSGVTTWMVYSFKTKRTKFKAKQHFQNKNIFFKS